MRKIFVFAIVIVFVSMLNFGCEEQQASSGDKKNRLVGVEIIKLKNQLEQCNKKFAESVRNCEAQKQKTKDDVTKLGKVAIGDFEVLAKLREENAALKARIKELEK